MPDKTTLLAVFAHPDDEAFPCGGTLAHYARQGHRVVLACATRGEAGQIKDPELAGRTDLAAIRTAELERACQALGIEPPVFLGYHDSGRFERVRQADPKALLNAELWEVEAGIRRVILEVKPRVLITFDPHGGYGHVDHLVIHRAATAAFYSAAAFGHAVERLIYTAFTVERATAMQQSGTADSIMGGLDPRVFGVSEDTVAVRMNVADYLPQKMAAVQAHRSQFSQRTQQMSQTEERRAMFERMMSLETFALGGSRGPVPRFPLHDLLDGLSPE